MATRLPRTIASLSMIRRLTAEDSSFMVTAVGHGGSFNLRRASSSSSSSSESSSSSKSPKAEKKLVDRLSAVIDAVNDRKLPPELRGQRNAVRSETDIVNIVEQRIWHSMEEGQFENLPGKGKPLNLNTNPHADPAEDTLYRILSRNNCAPEWVELNKEIRSNVSQWRLALKKAWTNRCNGDHSKWAESSQALKIQLRDINNKFENLPGKGKPLNLNTNPHADPAEDTLYRILSRNNCAPEWVELNKEIRSNVSQWRLALKKAWTNRCNGDHSKWAESSQALKIQLRDINNKVFRYNLIVPFGRQIFGLNWQKELDRLEE